MLDTLETKRLPDSSKQGSGDQDGWAGRKGETWNAPSDERSVKKETSPGNTQHGGRILHVVRVSEL